LRGDGQRVYVVAPAAEQRRALDALLRTIRSSELVMPERLLNLLPPAAFGYARTPENFRSHTGLTFDPLGAAEAAANLTIGLILNPQRAARLEQQHAETQAIDGLAGVIDRLLAATWRSPADSGPRGAVQRTVNSVALYHLMALAANAAASEPVRAVAFSKLHALRISLEATPHDALADFAIAQIRKFESEPKEVNVPKPAEPPPGQPIGCDWDR
jgi:hypothetical protein